MCNAHKTTQKHPQKQKQNHRSAIHQVLDLEEIQA
jgi:hypothetical protein